MHIRSVLRSAKHSAAKNGFEDEYLDHFECSESSDEEDDEMLEQQADLDAMFVQNVQTLALSAAPLGVTDNEASRAPRRWQEKDGIDDFYSQMEQLAQEDQKILSGSCAAGVYLTTCWR